MATKARIVYGSSIEWGTDGTTYTNLPEARTLAVPAISQDYQEVTNLDSPDGFREYIPGLKDANEITLGCNYTTALFSTAFGYQTNKTLIHFRTTLPLETGQSTTGDVVKFTAFVTPSMQQNAAGEPIALDLILRTSGAVTFTAGS